MTSRYIPQLSFSFYRHRAIRADFSGGQITSDAGLLTLRAFDERHHLTRDWAALLGDPRQEERVQHDALALLRQRIYQIVAGYEDANDADRLRHDPALQIVADQKLGEPLGSQPTLSRWEDHVCDIKTLQNWMGHKDLASTMVYLKAVRNKDVMARVNSSELAGLAI